MSQQYHNKIKNLENNMEREGNFVYLVCFVSFQVLNFST